MPDFPYWLKQTKNKPLYPDVAWNLPEQKQGVITLVGGHAGSFATALRTSEYLLKNYQLKDVHLVLPESLQKHLPPMGNLIFAPASPAGSFAPSPKLDAAVAEAQALLMIGDFSKNSAAELAITRALTNLVSNNAEVSTATEQKPNKSPNNIDKVDRTKTEQKPPVVLTRDAVDLLGSAAEDVINYEHLTLVATMAQLQKLLRALYYPKVLLLSMPLAQVVEVLHKFTLSYPVTILTFHAEHLLTAYHGKVISTPLLDTAMSPLSMWNGQLAARVVALQFFAPADPLAGATAAVLMK